MEALKGAANPGPIFLFIPEEKAVLVSFGLGRAGSADRLQAIGVVARIIHDRGNRHRGGREVLHLFKLKTQFLGLTGQLSHVFQA